MPQVTPRKTGYKGQYTEDFNKMLNRFKRACNKAGIVQEVKKRQYYVKPNEVKNQLNSKLKRKKKLDKFKAQNEGRRKASWELY